MSDLTISLCSVRHQTFLAEDINPVQPVVALVDDHHGPPLGNVGSLRPAHHQDRLVEVDEGKGVHSHVGPHVLLQTLLCHLLK